MISAKDVQRLREETGAGVMDCKRALEQARGDVAKARDILRELGFARAENKAGREATQGLVEAYIHGGGRIGVLVEINSETDFVARSPEFRELARDVAMQIAAMAPRFVAPDDIPASLRDELAREGRPEKEVDRLALLAQPWIRDESQTIEQRIKALIAKVGENVRVRRFARFEIGG